MRNILDVYKEYKIMPQLREHQLRVAAVGKQLCDAMVVPVDTKTVVSALLLHDMGNILKFDLGFFPQFCEPQGREYWEEVKRWTAEKFGDEEHQATFRIAQEFGVSPRVLDCLNTVGFLRVRECEAINDLEKKVCSYADMRVGPFGVISASERAGEGKKRNEKRKSALSEEDRAAIKEALLRMEEQLFAQTSIKPEDINDASIAPIMETLKTFAI